MRFDPPPWHKVFPLGTCVDLISSIIRSYCRDALVAVRREGAGRSESDAPPLVFEEVVAAPPANDTTSIDAISIPSIDAPIPAQLSYAAAKVFGKFVLRPRQVTAVHKLVYCKSSEGKLLVVDRTGGGKSLILSLAAVMVGGITYVIIPLLALTANQMAKLKEALTDDGAIEVHHLDELKKSAVRTKLIPRMLAMSSESSTTMFLLSSPQYLAGDALFRNALVQCQAQRTLRLVAIDEVHLYTQHGRTFRECIRYLRDVFFRVVFDVSKTYHPLFLAMTATFTKSMVEHFSNLTNVEWGIGYCPIPRFVDGPCWGGAYYPHQLWASFSDFRQRYIKMGLAVTGQIGQVALPALVTHLNDNPNSYAAMYVNFKAETSKWAGKLERLLATALMSIDVLQINGDMDKVEKFFFIRLFTRAIANPLFLARVLVATAAANTGIDQEMLDFVLRVGLPRCIITALQERGRNARKEGMVGYFVVYTSWLLFIKLMLQVLVEGAPEASEGGQSINTMIRAFSPLKRAVPNTPSHPRRPLSKEQKHDNMVEAYNDLIDVVSLYFLPGLGCVHSRMEWFMANGELMDPPPMMMPCVTQCFVCDGTYEKYILPIVYEGALEFLSSKVLTDKLPFEISIANCDSFLDSLYKEESWLIRVFGISSVKKYNVASFFFQLIGSRILSFEKSKDGKAVIVFARDTEGQYKYKNIVNWEGFLFRTKAHGRGMVRMTFGDLLNNNAINRWKKCVEESSGLN